MEIPEGMSKELKSLWTSLIELHHFFRKYTKKNYNRINPFYEDLFDWADRGSFWTQEDKGVTIYNSSTLIGDVQIGKNTWIGPFCILDGGGSLKIGNNCSVSTGCQLLTHDTVNWALSGGKMPYEYDSTEIGDCCFIGSFAIICKGVTIGKHCVVGAGSVVLEDVPDYTIVGGVPARHIGEVIIDEKSNVNLVYSQSLTK